MASNASGARFGGIDAVKLAAAFLVVAIHTGPLLTYGEYGDFLLTGIFARLAVPLFFTASGYLFFRKLQGHPRKDGRALRKYGARIAALYAVAIVIYLPLNVYKGDFVDGVAAGALIRDILVDGTFYHLWYLPALWLGIYIVYFLHKRLPVGGVLAITSALYVVGLLGDSYYGLVIRSDVLERVYDWLFRWFDYTRNGLFFAPVFLALGLWAARRPDANEQQRGVQRSRVDVDQEREVQGSRVGVVRERGIQRSRAAIDQERGVQRSRVAIDQEQGVQQSRASLLKGHGVHRHGLGARSRWRSFAARQRPAATRRLGLTALFLLSLAGLFAEGIALRAVEWPRHDSMYVMLLPAVGTLFLLALRMNIRVGPLAGPVSQWLYLLHPAAIVVVRGVAGAAGMDRLLTGHSLLHYAAVCALSLVAALAVSLFAERRRKRKLIRILHNPSTPPTMS